MEVQKVYFNQKKLEASFNQAIRTFFSAKKQYMKLDERYTLNVEIQRFQYRLNLFKTKADNNLTKIKELSEKVANLERQAAINTAKLSNNCIDDMKLILMTKEREILTLQKKNYEKVAEVETLKLESAALKRSQVLEHKEISKLKLEIKEYQQNDLTISTLKDKIAVLQKNFDFAAFKSRKLEYEKDKEISELNFEIKRLRHGIASLKNESAKLYKNCSKWK